MDRIVARASSVGIVALGVGTVAVALGLGRSPDRHPPAPPIIVDVPPAPIVVDVPPPPPEPIVVRIPQAPPPAEIPGFMYRVGIAGDSIYWTRSGAGGATASLWRAPVGGGVQELVEASAGYAFAIAGDHIYFTDLDQHTIRDHTAAGTRELARGETEALEIVTGGGYVYWTAWDRHVVYRVATTGGAVEALPVGDSPDPIAADDRYLYVLSVRTGTLSRIAHGTRRAEPLARGLAEPNNVVVTGDSIYATAGGGLYRVPLSGGAATRVATGGRAAALVAGPDGVYWTSWGGDGVPALPGCQGFNVGVLRRVTDAGVETLRSGCDLRGIAVDANAAWDIEMSRLVRR